MANQFLSFGIIRKEFSLDEFFNEVNIALPIAEQRGQKAKAQLKKEIDIALEMQEQPIFKAIAAQPMAWFDLAARAGSEVIFIECSVHAAGLYKTEEVQGGLATLNATAKRSIKRMAEEIGLEVARTAGEIARLGPESLVADPTNSDSARCTAYALKVFRQRYGLENIEGRVRDATDFGHSAFRQMWEAEGAHFEDTDVFEDGGWMTRQDSRVVMKHLKEIKTLIRYMSKGLCKNRSRLDVEEYPLKHFTFAEPGPNDYPWLGGQLAPGYDPTRTINLGESDSD